MRLVAWEMRRPRKPPPDPNWGSSSDDMSPAMIQAYLKKRDAEIPKGGNPDGRNIMLLLSLCIEQKRLTTERIREDLRNALDELEAVVGRVR